MSLKDLPIQKKLMALALVTSGVVLFLTCSAFFVCDFIAIRKTTLAHLSTLASVLADNSTAVLAFENHEDASEVLSSLKAERHIASAALYTKNGQLFSYYPANAPADTFPLSPQKDGFHFQHGYLAGFQPVIRAGNNRLGTLYLSADSGAIYERLRLYGLIVVIVNAISFVVAYPLSRSLQKHISQPVLSLALTAKDISERRDYSVRATKQGEDELGVLTDAFNQMLSQIQILNEDLERRVNERTAELQEANKELEAFSYSVSHDLRAPLRHVQGYVELVVKHGADTLNDRCRRYLKIASDSVTQMGELIDNLLDFSRMGRVEMRCSVVDLSKLITEAVSVLEPEVCGRNITWKHGRLPEVRGDPALLKQVLFNLLSNAVKYTKPREQACIETGIAGEKGGQVVMFVRDNGVGFEMQYVNKLFGVFQRLHRTEDFPGTGVGLANARRIITRHGGRIWAEAVPDHGATFYFTVGAVKQE